MKKSINYLTQIRRLKTEGFTALNCSHGNTKLVSTEETAFLIWNLPAVKTCPNRTPHCEELCYARKAEELYKDCLPSRIRNFKDSRDPAFITRMILTIMIRYQYMRSEKLVVRIHESGDFYNQRYTSAWLEIAAFFANNPDIKFIAYTKSFAYFDGVQLPANFSLRASVWDDTKKEDLLTIWRNGWNIYAATKEIEKVPEHARCRCEDCATCGHCWASRIKTIVCEIH